MPMTKVDFFFFFLHQFLADDLSAYLMERNFRRFREKENNGKYRDMHKLFQICFTHSNQAKFCCLVNHTIGPLAKQLDRTNAVPRRPQPSFYRWRNKPFMGENNQAKGENQTNLIWPINLNDNTKLKANTFKCHS
jgi:hypothetical protein